MTFVMCAVQIAGRSTSTANMTTWDVVRKVHAAEGLPGFWRGAVPRMTSVALWGTCMSAAYEALKRLCVIED